MAGIQGGTLKIGNKCMLETARCRTEGVNQFFERKIIEGGAVARKLKNLNSECIM